MHHRRIRAAALGTLLLVVTTLTATACQPAVDCDGDVYFPGADLSNTDQSDKQLEACDLSGIDFSGADFTDAYLRNANLSGSSLAGATFAGTDLKNARLAGADIAGAEFGATASFLVSSGNLTGTPASLPADWSLAGGYLVGPSANLVGAQLAGVDLSLTNLTYAFLTGADLTGANLTYTSMANTNLDGTALAGADLGHVTSGGIAGTPASLPDGWTLVAGTLIGPVEDEGQGQTECSGGEACSVPPVTNGGTTTSASFGPGTSTVTLVLSINPTDAPAFSCDSYPQGPDRPIIEFYFTGGDASDRIGTLTTTYESGSEPDLSEYQVCWAAPYPFVATNGSSLGIAEVQGFKPGTAQPLYVGVLADCQLTETITLDAPCVSSRTWEYTSGVTVEVSTTGADPWRY